VLKLKPTYIVEHVTDINLEDLKNDNIRGLILDLDNTIMPPKSMVFPENIARWLELVKNDFKIAILSNNPHKNYVRNAGELAGCAAYEKAGKPRRAAAIKALKDLDLLPEQVVMVGDRPLTDIWVGQRIGIVTILVDPLMKREEIHFIKFLRKLERFFITSPLKKFSKNDDDNKD